jgi:hypothetical protein
MEPISPRREKEVRQCGYFRQNGYFAGSSKASSFSEIDSVGSRDNELEELRALGEPVVHDGPLESEPAFLEEKDVEEDTQQLSGSATADLKSPQDYTVACVCALPIELIAFQTFLEEMHECPLGIRSDDPYDYGFGKIGSHNMVISVVPWSEDGRVLEDIYGFCHSKSEPKLSES